LPPEDFNGSGQVRLRTAISGRLRHNICNFHILSPFLVDGLIMDGSSARHIPRDFSGIAVLPPVLVQRQPRFNRPSQPSLAARFGRISGGQRCGKHNRKPQEAAQ
jgi:hypothetical protein